MKYTIKTVIVGVLQVNCYIFYDNETKEAMIIDPGSDGENIIKHIDNLDLEPKIIINTHYHFDHTCANTLLKKIYSIPLAIGINDATQLTTSYKDAHNFMIECQPSEVADILLKENNKINIGAFNFHVLETPGHTKGSICLFEKNEKLLFSGDTLFFESVGRWDLEGGDSSSLTKSLNKLMKLPEETTVYPGHGITTTLKHEKKFNPFI